MPVPMTRQPEIGDYVILADTKPLWLRNADIYKVTEICPNLVKYVLVSEVTPVRGIRKFYKKSNRVFECTHSEFANDFSLDVRSVYEAEISVVTDNWSILFPNYKED